MPGTTGCSNGIRYGTVNNYYNGSSSNTTTIQNNEVIDFYQGIFVSNSDSPGRLSIGTLCGPTVQQNYVHGSTISSPLSVGIYISGANCILADSPTGVTVTGNYVTNTGGITGAGSGILFANGVQQLIDTYNATSVIGYNNLSCGGPYGNWQFSSMTMTIKGNEAFNSFPATNNRGNCDVGAFDLDRGSSNAVFEYNYGHETWGPTLGIFNSPAGSYLTGNNTIAFNIFENGGMFSGDNKAMIFPLTGTAGPLSFYNNVIWNGYNGTTTTVSPTFTVKTGSWGFAG